MNIVTVCQGGNTRSVSAAWILKDRGHNAVAVGGMYAFSNAFNPNREPGTMLSRWADLILIMSAEVGTEEAVKGWVPSDCHGKLRFLEVGPDHYGGCFTTQELADKVRAELQRIGL